MIELIELNTWHSRSVIDLCVVCCVDIQTTQKCESRNNVLECLELCFFLFSSETHTIQKSDDDSADDLPLMARVVQATSATRSSIAHEHNTVEVKVITLLPCIVVTGHEHWGGRFIICSLNHLTPYERDFERNSSSGKVSGLPRVAASTVKDCIVEHRHTFFIEDWSQLQKQNSNYMTRYPQTRKNRHTEYNTLLHRTRNCWRLRRLLLSVCAVVSASPPTTDECVILSLSSWQSVCSASICHEHSLSFIWAWTLTSTFNEMRTTNSVAIFRFKVDSNIYSIIAKIYERAIHARA